MSHVRCVNEETHPNLIDNYNDVFEGKGKLGNEYKIELDETVTPIVNAPRRVPFSLMPELKKKLNSLEKGGQLVKVTEPTEWVSSLVVIRKPNGKLRICLDPTNLNKAIKRHHYPMPCIEEIIPQLNNAKVFSLLDAKDGFW